MHRLFHVLFTLQNTSKESFCVDFHKGTLALAFHVLTVALSFVSDTSHIHSRARQPSGPQIDKTGLLCHRPRLFLFLIWLPSRSSECLFPILKWTKYRLVESFSVRGLNRAAEHVPSGGVDLPLLLGFFGWGWPRGVSFEAPRMGWKVLGPDPCAVEGGLSSCSAFAVAC